MKLPAFLYGLYRDVKPQCQRLITAIRRGVHIGEFSDEVMNTDGASGHIVLDGPAPNLGDAPHFHVFAPARAVVLSNRLTEQQQCAAADEFLGHSWGILSLLGQTGYQFVNDSEFRVALVRAVLTHWNEFVAVGPRYSTGTQVADEIWRTPLSSLFFALAQMGITREEMLPQALQNAESIRALMLKALECEPSP